MNTYAAIQAPDVLLAYIFRSTRPQDAASFRRLVGPQGRLGGVTATCFLLYRGSPDPQPCVHSFLFRLAPTLLQQLSRTMEPERVTLRDRVRGKVDWPSTYKARYGEAANPTTFVCLQGWRHFDRPENQLFKFMLHQIRLCLNRVPPILRGWYAWGKPLRSPAGPPLEIGERLAVLDHRERILSAHVSLRGVRLPAAIGGRHLLAARSSKNELYAAVADLYDLYQGAVNDPEWERWSALLNQTLPLPPNAGEFGRLLVG